MTLVNMPRRSLLSLALLGILAVSVLAAWTMVRARRGPIDRAEAILRLLRDRKLDAYWGGKRETAWYLIEDSAGQPVGYAVRARWRREDGYNGVSLGNIQGRQHAEQWTIDIAATKGAYLGDGGLGRAGETGIDLADGRVTVRQSQQAATKAAPDNYIPEGLMRLAAAQVAEQDGPAVFTSVFNSAAIQWGEVNFTQVKMTPLGDGAVRATAVVRGREGDFKVDQTYHVDSAGRVVRLDDNVSGAVQTLVDVAELEKVFPEVSQLREYLNIAPEAPTNGKDAAPESSPGRVQM